MARKKFVEFMKKVGFSPTENPYIWAEPDNRKSMLKKLIGVNYDIAVYVPLILKDDVKLRRFVRKYKKFLVERKSGSAEPRID